MPLNPYFDQMISTEEQGLLGDLIEEAMQQVGVEAYLLPRTLINVSDIFNEEQTARFTSNIPIYVYVGNVEGFGGQGQFLSKFGMEVRDRIVFSISVRQFDESIKPVTGQVRPSEGDLIYLPMTGGLYEIMFVEPEIQAFYQLGKLYTYDMNCELFEYNDEELSTGIPEVDQIQTDYNTNTLDSAIVDSSGEMIATSDGNIILYVNGNVLSQQDDMAQNDVFNDEAEDIVDFSIGNPFSELFRAP